MTPQQIISKTIGELIFQESKGNFKEYFFTWLLKRSNQFYGFITESEFKIWRKNGWSSLFFPVVIGSIETENGKIKVNLKSKTNSFRISIGLIILLIFTFGWLLEFILVDGLSWQSIGMRISIIVALDILLVFPFYVFIRNENKIEKERIMKVCLEALKNIQTSK